MRGTQHGNGQPHDQPGQRAHSPQGPGITKESSDEDSNPCSGHDRHDHNEIGNTSDATLYLGVGSGHKTRVKPQRGSRHGAKVVS